ncbi:MAG: peptide chain release factor-like protein [Planctomycetes bacterium]|nr:peptide chain release factor-like protein [Planctomycetota bacterium]
MRFPDDAPVTAAKRDALRERLARLGVDLGRVEEQAVKAGGPGGQRVNKTSSGVRLAYALGDETVAVKWTRERSHALNRFLALRELADEVEVRVSPATSERLRERERVRRRKDRARRRRTSSDPPAERTAPPALEPPPRAPAPSPGADAAARSADDT